MKLALMSNNENVELYHELRREFITDTYKRYLDLIISDICQELQTDISITTNSDFYKELCHTVIITINKVWLDNLLKYITHSNVHTFTTLIDRQMLGQDIFVNLFYTRQITNIVTKYVNLDTEELDSVTNILSNRLHWIINNMYVVNSARYNEILVRIMNNIYLIVGNIQFKYYKFELDQYFRPVLIYIEKEPNETFYT